jgi:hypothetical protein
MILGIDFYDKFLILQALKQRFPDRLFFTTDLDARLLQPTNIEWTRNLIVASSFGFQLQEEYQGDAPPFRDSYSTAIFAGVQQALGKIPKSEPEPRIFEIGRYNAIDLTDGTIASFNQSLPPKTELPLRLMISFFSYILLIILLLFWFLHFHLLNILRKAKDRVTQWLLRNPDIGLISVVTFLILLVFLLKMRFPEPFSLFEGISTWPTVIIRIVALCLTIVFLFSGAASLRTNSKQISRDYKLPLWESTESEKDTVWWQTRKTQLWRLIKWLGKFFDNVRYLFLRNKIEKHLKKNSPDTVASMWQTYNRDGNFKVRFLRILFSSGIYIFFASIFVTISGMPIIPARGAHDIFLNRIILSLALFGFLFLTFYVLDVTGIFKDFVNKFIGTTPIWSISSFLNSGSVHNLSKEAMNNLKIIQLVALRTEAIGHLIFYPFIIWLLLFVSRLPYFDYYPTPFGLIIVIFLGLFLAWFAAVLLRRSSENLRKDVLVRLGQKLLEAKASKAGEADINFVQKVIEEIKEIHRGAFAPLLEQPTLQALLVPIGGYSTVKLLEIFFQFT